MRAFCFPGQGPQEPELARQLTTFPDWNELQSLAFHITGYSIDSLLTKDIETQQSELRRNEVASLLTVLYSLCSLRQLNSTAVQTFEANKLAGYSVGQFVALHVAGCFDVPDLLKIVWQRCLLMNQANKERPGKMAAVIGLKQEQLEALVEPTNVSISNYNARGQYTVAGEIEDVQKIVSASIDLGAHKSIMINVDGAWHSQHMTGAAEAFHSLLARMEIQQPKIPVIDNVTGKLFSADIKKQLVEHLHQPVRWEEGIRHLIKLGVSEFIEVGYGNMLSKFGFFISRDCRFTPTAKLLKQFQRRYSGGDQCAA